MAFPAKHVPFILLIVLFSCTQILARESKFFSKFNHHEKTSIPNNTSTTIITTNQGKQEEETNFTPQATNGYGLYGHDLNQSPSTTTTTENTEEYTYPSVPYKTPTEEYTGGRYESNKEVNTYNNNENYSYNNKQFGMSDTRFMDNANVNNNNNMYETKRYGYGNMNHNNNNNNGYENKEQDTWVAENGNKEKYYNNDRYSNSKQQGLSDTRFMENGRYFYNVNNENSYLNEYKPVSRSYDGYKRSQGVNSRNSYNYGNNENTEESQYQGEENQEAFSP